MLRLVMKNKRLGQIPSLTALQKYRTVGITKAMRFYVSFPDYQNPKANRINKTAVIEELSY